MLSASYCLLAGSSTLWNVFGVWNVCRQYIIILYSVANRMRQWGYSAQCKFSCWYIVKVSPLFSSQLHHGLTHSTLRHREPIYLCILTLILTWINNHLPSKVWGTLLVHSNLLRLYPWSLGRDKYFHATHNDRYDYLSMRGLKLIRHGKNGLQQPRTLWACKSWGGIKPSVFFRASVCRAIQFKMINTGVSRMLSCQIMFFDLKTRFLMQIIYVTGDDTPIMHCKYNIIVSHIHMCMNISYHEYCWTLLQTVLTKVYLFSQVYLFLTKYKINRNKINFNL